MSLPNQVYRWEPSIKVVLGPVNSSNGLGGS